MVYPKVCGEIEHLVECDIEWQEMDRSDQADVKLASIMTHNPREGLTLSLDPSKHLTKISIFEHMQIPRT